MASTDQFCDEITCDSLKDFQVIGRGAFGIIYQARHHGWGIDVAVKILNSDTACTRKELLNEARAMDKARQSNHVIHLLGLFVDKVPAATKEGCLAGPVPSLGLVMEFMEHGSLASLQSRIPYVPWALRLRALHEIALGMNFLHGLNPPLLHLDLKPSNVLLDEDLHVRVADFGLSKFKQGTSFRSVGCGEGDGYGGTLEYMPPEAFTDMNYKPSKGTDVYSYGILMWSLLTGEKPYPYILPNNMSSLIKMLIPQGQRPSIEELEKSIPEVQRLEEMVKLMKDCWHNEMNQRPSFLECRQKIENIYSSYKPEIKAAVRHVQDILVRMDRSPAAEISSSSLTPSRAIPVSCTSEWLQPQFSQNSSPGLEQFETIRVRQSPPKQNEAVPIKPLPHSNPKWKPFHHTFQRSSSLCFRKELPNGIPPHPEAKVASHVRPRESKPRPLSDIFPFQTFPPYYPEHVRTPQSFYNPHLGNAGSTPGQSSIQVPFHPGFPQGSLCIYGQGIQGIQVGGGNVMHIELPSGSKPQKKD